MTFALVGVGIVAVAALAWAGAAFALDRHGKVAAPTGPYDAVIVAGCKVHADGRPSQALARRVRMAVALYHAGHAPRIVLTGGVGRDAPVSEAHAAAELCEAHGVPRSGLLLEEHSTTTLENAAFAARIAPVEWSVVVVSDTAHVFRCRRMFGRHFRRVDAVGAVPPLSPRLRLALREVGAVVRHGLLGHLGPGAPDR